MPNIQQVGGRLMWWANPYFAITRDGQSVAYISSRNEKSNIYVRSLTGRGGSQQRTFQGGVQDVCFSPDGETICFTKRTNKASGFDNSIFTTSAKQGAIVRQISTPNTKDYGVSYSLDGKRIYFSRNEGKSYAIWSHELSTGTLTNYCMGLCPRPISEDEFLCMRQNSQNNYEIWLVDIAKGNESILLSQENRSFTTPMLSPDGKWIVCTSNTQANGTLRENLDIYVVASDGSELTRLTYHPGRDDDPVWSADGRSIYFSSQRGNTEGAYHVWKIDFEL